MGDNTTIALQDTDWGPASASGEWSSDELQLPDGHYKLEYEQTNPSVPGNLKHKAFWVDCGTQPGEGTVGVFKYNDADGNGHRDNGHPEVEPGLPGWTFTIQQIVDDALVGPVCTITTGSDGNGDFGSFPRGMYRVCETPQNGWTNTDPGGTAQKSIVLTSTSLMASVSFGNAQVRLPSTSTDGASTLGIYGLLVLALAVAVALWPITRRTTHST